MEIQQHSVRSGEDTTGIDSSNTKDQLPLDASAGLESIELQSEPQYQSLAEKGIRLLCSDLLQLKVNSAEEIRENVCAHYSTFIRTSQELGKLEAELTNMQTMISSHAFLIGDLLEGTNLQSKSSEDSNPSLKKKEDNIAVEFDQKFHILSDGFDVYITECRVDEAATTLCEMEEMVSEAKMLKTMPYCSILSDRKERLIIQLVNIASQPNCNGNELRKVVSLLNRLRDGSRAHTLLLQSYHERIKNDVQNVRPTCSWYAGSYIKNLGQVYFSIIMKASNESLKIFGNNPSCASELVIWACMETEDYIAAVKKHVLSTLGCGIGAIADCVHISLSYCTLLEKQGLSLCPQVLKSLRPCVEGILDKYLKRMEEGILIHCCSDNWVSTETVIVAAHIGQKASMPTSYGLLTLSAYKHNVMLKDLLEDAVPFTNTAFERVILEGVLKCFSFYVKLLIRALPHTDVREDAIQMDGDIELVTAKLVSQQLAILGNASILAEEVIPSLFLKWLDNTKDTHKHDPERASASQIQLLTEKEWRRFLQRAVDELRDAICEQHIIELLFDEDEKPLLTVELYLGLNNDKEILHWLQDPMPSAPFQALLMKIQDLEVAAKSVLAGRERIILLLLMRLTEAFMVWLSEDEYFWDFVEDSSKTLPLIGFQQFIFDMQFINQIAVVGEYASKKIKQMVSSIVSRAENAYLIAGSYPESALRGDDWFENHARRALYRILDSSPNMQNRDLTSEEYFSDCVASFVPENSS